MIFILALLAQFVPVTPSGAVPFGVPGSFCSTFSSSATTGCLTSADWTTFNSKQASIGAGGLVDSKLASAYSGVGSCGANTWASALSRNSAPTCTQPGFTNLTGTASIGQIPGLPASQINSGTFTDSFLASAYSGVGSCGANTFATALARNSAPTCTQPTFSMISGSATDSQLSSAYSGTGVCGANTWASSLTRNAAPTCTQPGFTNLTGTASVGQIPSLPASQITSGTLPQARGGTGAGALTCSAGDFITSNGTAQSCGTPSGGGVINQSTNTASFGACGTLVANVLTITVGATGNYMISGDENITPSNGDSVSGWLSVNAGAAFSGTLMTISNTDPFNSSTFAVHVQTIASLTIGDVVRLRCQASTTAGSVGAASLILLKVT